MIGADKYCKLFKSPKQFGRLYVVPGSHARGATFRIYVLPRGENAIKNGPNAPLNIDAVEVYGIIGGQPGWTESYGWLHEGSWQKDFEAVCEIQKKMIRIAKEEALAAATKRQREKEAKIKTLLNDY